MLNGKHFLSNDNGVKSLFYVGRQGRGTTHFNIVTFVLSQY